MKIIATIHIHYCKYPWEDKAEYVVFSHRMDDDEHRAYIGEQQIEIDVPDGFDPRAQQIASLEEKKRKVAADYQRTVDDINERISKLQAIAYTA